MSIIVTTALVYANGELHLGHLLEHIQADIWVRHQRAIGQQCYFIGADDTHGAPIMLKAQQLQMSPVELINMYYSKHLSDLVKFGISYDNFYSTHSPENQALLYEIYHKLCENNKITRKNIAQLYDNTVGMFLADRFVQGICPKCQATAQYGDSCESCGGTYNATELINPRSMLSGSTPILRYSEHYFFALSSSAEFLTQWLTNTGRLPIAAYNKLQEWLDNLHDWDISRDEPYFGFEIPAAPGKFFYVWLDAPIGYMSSLQHYCNNHGIDFTTLWQNSNNQIYHFFGKDVLYFHALFWPAVLDAAAYRTPDALFPHGFLTINGQKMSKSRGNFIEARQLADTGIDVEYWRYYLASKLSSKIEDVDFNAVEFQHKINAEVVGKFINIAARIAKFLALYFDNKLAATMPVYDMLDKLCALQTQISTLYTARETASVVRLIMQQVDLVNIYIDDTKPWLLAKNSEQHINLHQCCTLCINAFRILAIYLQAIMPQLVQRIATFLQLESLSWNDINTHLVAHHIQQYTHLASRIDEQQYSSLFNC